ncbi:protection of telomeres protein 1, partial [Tremellales sp. Uapishka_1]
MAEEVSTPFANSKHLAFSDIGLDTVLLPATHVTGKITTVWSKLTAPDSTVPRLAFQIRTSLVDDSVLSHYAAAPPTTSAYDMKFVLRPAANSSARQNSIMETDLEVLQSLVGKAVTVSCAGLHVVSKDSKKKVVAVELAARGSRLMGGKDGKVWTLLKEPPPPESTPAWFASSASSIPSPPPPPRRKGPSEGKALLQAVASSSKSTLLPLSAHSIPRLLKRPSTDSVNASRPPEKKARAGQSASMDSLMEVDTPDSSLEEQTKGKTIIHLEGAVSAAENRSPKERPLLPFSSDLKVPLGRVVQGRSGPDANSSPSPVKKSNENPLPIAPGEVDTEMEGPADLPLPDFAAMEKSDQEERIRRNEAEQRLSALKTEAIRRRREMSEAEREKKLEEEAAEREQQRDIEFQRRVPEGKRRSAAAAQKEEGVAMAALEREKAEAKELFERKEAGDKEAQRKIREALARKAQEFEAEKRKEADADEVHRRRAVAEANAQKEIERRKAEKGKAKEQEGRLEKGFTASGVDYRPLASLPERGTVNIFGVVVKMAAAKQLRSGEFSVTLVITDPSKRAEGADEDLVITANNLGSKHELPTLFPGTPVLLHNVKGQMQTFNNKLKGVCWSGRFLHGSVVDGRIVPHGPPLEIIEIDRLKALQAWWTETSNHGARGIEGGTPSGDGGEGSSKSTLEMRDIVEFQFFNAVFKILHVVENGRNPMMELYVTDGTCYATPPRNFHGLDFGIPATAVYCIAILDVPSAEEKKKFKVGNVIKMYNIRPKMYQGQLDLVWSEKMTEQQARDRWSTRWCRVFTEEDERYREIDMRISALKRGEVVGIERKKDKGKGRTIERPLSNQRGGPLEQISQNLAVSVRGFESTALDRELATHLSSTYTDETNYPTSTIPEILSNGSVPNKFRLHARVHSIVSRSAGSKDLIHNSPSMAEDDYSPTSRHQPAMSENPTIPSPSPAVEERSAWEGGLTAPERPAFHSVNSSEPLLGDSSALNTPITPRDGNDPFNDRDLNHAAGPSSDSPPSSSEYLPPKIHINSIPNSPASADIPAFASPFPDGLSTATSKPSTIANRRSQRAKHQSANTSLKSGKTGKVRNNFAAAQARKPFQSTRLKGEIYKPWLEKKDPAQRWARWITIGSIILGFAIAGIICWDGYNSVPNLGKICSVLNDDFSNGIDPNTWTREVRLDGYDNGEFEWTTASDDNAFVKDNTLYLVPTLTTDVLTADQITNGYTLNLTADGTCTSTNVTQCVAVSNSSLLTVINPVRSARLTTKNSVNIKYGKVEVRARFPTGDWLWPGIFMLPVNNTYGPWPRSGEIDIMEGRGNNASYSARGVDYAQSSLHWGPTTILDRLYLTWGYREQRRTYYNQKFHTFGLEWNEKFMWTYIDSRVSQVISLRFNKESFWQRGDFPSTITNDSAVIKLTNPWIQSGNNVAPFDQPFYLILDLAVGATDGWFPDGEGGKPWLDDSGTSMSDFWIAKDKWYPSWPTDVTKRGMAIESVKMWEKC